MADAEVGIIFVAKAETQDVGLQLLQSLDQSAACDTEWVVYVVKSCVL